MIYILFLFLMTFSNIGILKSMGDEPTAQSKPDLLALSEAGNQIKFFLRGGRAFLKKQENLEHEEGVVSFDKETPLNEKFIETLDDSKKSIIRNSIRYSSLNPSNKEALSEEEQQKAINIVLEKVYNPSDLRDKFLYSHFYEEENLEEFSKKCELPEDMIANSFVPKKPKEFYLRRWISFYKKGNGGEKNNGNNFIASLAYQNFNDKKNYKSEEDSDIVFVSWIAADSCKDSMNIYKFCDAYLTDKSKEKSYLIMKFISHNERFINFLQEYSEKNEYKFSKEALGNPNDLTYMMTIKKKLKDKDN